MQEVDKYMNVNKHKKSILERFLNLKIGFRVESSSIKLRNENDFKKIFSYQI